MKKEGIVFAFGEIFLKSKGVQRILKQKLINNIHLFLKRAKVDFRIFSFYDRVFVETKELKKASRVLKRTFGIAWLAPGFFLKDACLEELASFVKENYQKWIKKGESFALRVKREKSILETRDKIIEKIAQNIKRKVDLSCPKREVFIEGKREGWFLYFEKEKGPGGLPVGSQGKVLVLISGGIDSPVAAYLAAKRGGENIWLHFHSFPLVSKASIEKVKDLAKIFLGYQPELKVYFLPFSKIQMKIKLNAPPKYRVLLYRRLMFKIAQKIAKRENCLALVTGESLAQVSSQTLVNLGITQKGLEIPVLRPLVGMDKEEIINLAKQIKTFEVSIKPQEDCCTLFVSSHQTAAGRDDFVQKLEKSLPITCLISAALKEAKVERFSLKES